MRRILILFLILILLCSSAHACTSWKPGDWMRVVNCNEYISLRSEPSSEAEVLDHILLGADNVCYIQSVDGVFAKVFYNGLIGYVMENYLENQHSVCSGCTAVNVNEQILYNFQLFLTNFSEQAFLWPTGVFSVHSAKDTELVDFAIEHIWYNRQDDLEWGEYFNENNVRLRDDQIQSVCKKYFGKAPQQLRSSIHERIDGYYYWQETGGHVPNGFCMAHEIRDMGDGRYRVGFRVYGMGMNWDSSVYSMDERSLLNKRAEYRDNIIPPCGNAVINIHGGNLYDRSTWTLEKLTIDWLC